MHIIILLFISLSIGLLFNKSITANIEPFSNISSAQKIEVIHNSIQNIYWDNTKNEPTPIFKELLTLEKIPPPTTYTELSSQLNPIWHRKKTIERWQLSNNDHQKNHFNTYLHIFKQLHLVDEILPSAGSHFDEVFILGSTVQTMIDRIHFFLSLEDIFYDKVTILTGKRKLEDFEKIFLENNFTITHIQTEEETSHFLNRLLLNNDANIICSQESSRNNRSTTADTFKTWYNKTLSSNNLSPKKILLISTQPYGLYQLSVILLNSKNSSFNIEYSLGAKQLINPENTPVPLFLDTINSTLYNLNQFKK